jgi:ectoine hydroxylase-related dioxygenase (phytanoyl-CoA dioxygenase family)
MRPPSGLSEITGAATATLDRQSPVDRRRRSVSFEPSEQLRLGEPYMSGTTAAISAEPHGGTVDRTRARPAPTLHNPTRARRDQVPSMTPVVTDEQRRQYREEGYFLLSGVLADRDVELLRGGAAYAIAKADAEMDARGTDRLDINARGRRYFSNNVARERPELRSFLRSDLMADICRATLGDTAYLFNEQYVIKCADRDTAFAWHQDSGYIHERHEPYLTCWIALDDVDESNGAVYLLPFSQVGIRTYVRHVKSPDVNDMVGYFGSAPGVAVEARTGSIVCFSSVVFHRSGPNLTERMRRVYVAQYSSHVILDESRSNPWAGFEPFLVDGRIIADTGGRSR